MDGENKMDAAAGPNIIIEDSSVIVLNREFSVSKLVSFSAMVFRIDELNELNTVGSRR